jgi:hypothetical protein
MNPRFMPDNAQAMVDAAARAGRKLFYGENWLYAPSIRRAMQLAAASGGAGAASSSSLAALAGATSFRGAAASLLRERGVAGLYAGVGPTMLQVLPSAALSYYAYEVFKARFGVVGGVQ